MRVLAAAVVLLFSVSTCAGAETPAETTTTTAAPQTTSTTTTTTTTTTTVPAPPAAMPPLMTGPARVAVIGDFGHGGVDEYIVAGRVQALSREAPLTALATTGDNFYSDAVDLIWTVPYGWVADQRVPVYASWGNHDIETKERIALVTDHLAPPGRWYAVEVGGASLIVLDSNQISSDEQLAWLQATLAAAAGPTIAVFHVPPYSCSKYGHNTSLLDRWVPLFIEHGVDLVLNGHAHHYERFTVEGITYVITGGGGRPLRSVKPCQAGYPEPDVTNDTDYHFVLLEIFEDRIEVTAIAANGVEVDSVVVPG